MPSLHELQIGFAQAVLGRDETGFDEHVLANGLTGARRIQVYRNNTFASLTEALAAIHPVVQRLVGEGFFRYAAHEYIRRYPSTSGNLHDFGGDFADFLAEFPAAAALPYLADAARLEWAWHQVFHEANPPPQPTQPPRGARGSYARRSPPTHVGEGANVPFPHPTPGPSPHSEKTGDWGGERLSFGNIGLSPVHGGEAGEGASGGRGRDGGPPLDLAALAAISPEHYGELQFSLHPASRPIASPYPVLRIWEVNQEGYAGEDTVDLAEGGVQLLVIRRGIEVLLEPLEPGEFALLQALAQGLPFASACGAALAAQSDIDLPVCLQGHVLSARWWVFSSTSTSTEVTHVRSNRTRTPVPDNEIGKCYQVRL